MAARSSSVVFLVLFASLHLMEMNGVAGIDILPDHFSEILPEDVHISCGTIGLEGMAKQVYLIQIGKKGEHPMAETRPNSTTTSDNDESNSAYIAEGRIDKNVSLSRLEVVLKSPTSEWSGMYECRVYYEDDTTGALVDHVTVSELSVTKTETVLRPLVQEIKTMLEAIVKSKAETSKKIYDLQVRMSALEKTVLDKSKEPKPTEASTDCIRGFLGICIPGTG